jgi:hypothetical protein
VQQETPQNPQRKPAMAVQEAQHQKPRKCPFPIPTAGSFLRAKRDDGGTS